MELKIYTILFFLVFFANLFQLSESQKQRNFRTKRDKVSSIIGGRQDKDINNEQELHEHGNNFDSKEHTVGFLPLPPGYNRLVIPLGNVSKSIFIMFYLSIRQVIDVDTDKGILELDTEIGITWIDWKIWKYFIDNKEAQKMAREGGEEEMILDAEFLNYIWKPDIFIEEMSSVERTFLLSKLITLRFLVKNDVMPGAITYKSRQTFKLECDMNFQYYPADTQQCSFHIRSYTYSNDKLFLVWNPNERVYLDEIDDPNYDFQISNVEPGEELYDLYTTSQSKCCSPQNFSTLTFTLQMRRNIRYHLLQTYLPSIILILVTWLCFLLPKDMVEVRIGISMTTLLTLTAMFTSVRQAAPAVSYNLAIDYWMVFCVFVVFIALSLFTAMHWMKRRMENIQDTTIKQKEDMENGHVSIEEIEIKANLPKTTVPVSKQYKQKRYQNLVDKSTKYAFPSFAIIFLGFILCYASWLLLYGNYFEWSPSPKYNSIDDGNSSDKLFAIQEKKFRPNSTKKTVESDFRFKDLFKYVIYPRLDEINGDDEDDGSSTTTENGNMETTTNIGTKNVSFKPMTSITKIIGNVTSLKLKNSTRS